MRNGKKPKQSLKIGTAEDFVAFLNNPGLNKYVLTSDIDMAGQTYVAQIFSGILDGQGHVIRNLSYNGGDGSGLFTYLRGIVRNIVFENASITSSGRAGLIAGEIDVTGVVIDNIVVKNLTVTGKQQNGVGGLVAVIKDGSGSASFSNIYMKNVTIVNTGQKNAGALVAYARGKEATVIRDIQLIDVSVKATEHAGGLIGCVKTTLPVTMERVVLENVKVEASNYAAGIIGRLYDSGYKDVTLSSAFIKGLEIICSGSYKNAVTGRYSDMGLASVFGGEFTIPSTSNGQTVQTLITDFDALDQDWFEENLPALTADPWSIVKGWPVLFSFPEDEAMPIIEVVGQPDNTAVKVAGTVIFLHKNGFFISDGTGAIYVFRYPTDADLKAKILPGAKVFLDGKLVIYNGLPEISDYTLTVLKEAPATGFDYQFAAPDAILTEIALAETNNPYAYGRILHVQGKILRSGNYFHLVDENFDVRVSFDNNHPQGFLEEIPAFEGKLVKVTVLTYDFLSSIGIWRVLGAPGSVQEIETYIYDDADLVAAIAAKLKSVLENTPVTQDLELPTLGVNDATIAWTSSHPDIIGNDGTFNAPAEDTEVELTAKVTLGTAEKEVVIKVIAKKAAVSSGTPVIISQAYGGGGNSGAKYKNDFIELYNTTDEDIDLTGWVVFYASKSKDFSKSNNMYIILSGTIKAKSFFLIQAAAESGGIENLPTPDAVCDIAMGGSGFKLALCNSDTLPTGPDSPNVVDFVGAGSANAYEGSGPAPAPSNTTAIVRPNLLDTDDNSVDFETAAPNPRNSAYVLE